MSVRQLAGAAALGLVVSGTASAQAVLQSKLLSADAANTMVMAALAQCQKDNYRVSAAVVDRGPVPIFGSIA